MHHLTAWRGIAILAVLILHIIPGLLPSRILLGPLRPTIIIIDQLMRFCVPLFVAISGYSLANKYPSSTSNWLPFLYRRVIKLLPLYIFWSTITAYIYHYTFSPALIKSIPWGIDYHLYFVPMIICLYCLFPFIQRFNQTPRTNIWLLWIAISIQIALYICYETTWKPFPSDQLQYHISLSWIFYFILGIIFAKINTNHPPFQLKIAAFIAATIGAIPMIYSAWPAISNPAHTIQFTRFTRISVIPYAIGIISIAILYSAKFKWPSFLLWLGKHSYLIYLSHVIALAALQNYLQAHINIFEYLTIMTIWVIAIYLSRYIPQ